MSTQPKTTEERVTSFTLYRDAHLLLTELYEREGVTDDEFDQSLESFFDGCEDKLDKHRYALDMFKKEEAMYRQEVQRLSKRARTLASVQSRIKDHAKMVLNARVELLGPKEGRSLETDLGLVYLKSTQRLEIDDPDLFMDDNRNREWVTYTPKIDKKAVTAALKKDQSIDGARMVSGLSVIFK